MLKLTFNKIISTLTLCACISLTVACGSDKTPHSPSWFTAVQNLEDNINQILKAGTYDKNSKLFEYQGGSYSLQSDTPNYLGTFLMNKFFWNQTAPHQIAFFDSKYIAFNQNFFQDPNKNVINPMLWTFTTDKTQIPNYQQKVRPELIKKNHHLFMDDFYQVYGAWPFPKASVSIYWQFILTNKYEYTGSYVLQQVINNPNWEVQTPNPFLNDDTVQKQNQRLWKIIADHVRLINNNLKLFKQNTVLYLPNDGLKYINNTLESITFNVMVYGQKSIPLKINITHT